MELIFFAYHPGELYLGNVIKHRPHSADSVVIGNYFGAIFSKGELYWASGVNDTTDVYPGEVVSIEKAASINMKYNGIIFQRFIMDCFSNPIK